MIKLILIVIDFLISGAIFYGIFFKIAPYVCSLIPMGAYKGLFDLIAYVLIAWFGGITIPIVVFLILFAIIQAITK